MIRKDNIFFFYFLEPTHYLKEYTVIDGDCFYMYKIKPMEKNNTLLKKIKISKGEFPRKFVIDNLLNYSKSLDVIKTSFGSNFVFSQN